MGLYVRGQRGLGIPVGNLICGADLREVYIYQGEATTQRSVPSPDPI
jgi:hypothetical protein